jgi:hypothetical protein
MAQKKRLLFLCRPPIATSYPDPAIDRWDAPTKTSSLPLTMGVATRPWKQREDTFGVKVTGGCGATWSDSQTS